MERTPQSDGSGPDAERSAMSCVQCRTRKVKCSRVKPSCASCARSGEDCVYPQSRQKQVHNRKNIRNLDVRLTQLEDRLSSVQPSAMPDNPFVLPGDLLGDLPSEPSGDWSTLPMPQSTGVWSQSMPTLQTGTEAAIDVCNLANGENCCPLRDELTDVYFRKAHYAAPMLHPSRYKASLNLPLAMQPPLCLQYIVTAQGALLSDTHSSMAMMLYHRARASAEADEQQGNVEKFVTVGHTQCWSLMANFEAQQHFFGRASVSLSRSLRLAQMLGLHKLDDRRRPRHPSLPEPRDWCETEARRRTFWVIFCSDRFLVGVAGWPALIQDRDINVLLPASEEAFNSATEERADTLEALFKQKSTTYSPLAGRVLAAHIFRRISDHVALSDQASHNAGHSSDNYGADRSDSSSSSREEDDDAADVKNGAFWVRHRRLDNELAQIVLYLPRALRLARAHRCVNAQFVHISLQTSVICLHRAACARADAIAGLDDERSAIRRHSAVRLLPAAQEILVALRLAATMADIEVLLRNPLLAFSAYMAAQVLLDDFVAEASRQSADDLGFLQGMLAAVGRQDNVVVAALAAQLAGEMRQHGLPVSEMDTPSHEDAAPLLEKRCADSTQFVFSPGRTVPRTDAASSSSILGATHTLNGCVSAVCADSIDGMDLF